MLYYTCCAVQDALVKGLLELVCVYYRKQAGIEEEEAEVEVRALVLFGSGLRAIMVQGYCGRCQRTDASNRNFEN